MDENFKFRKNKSNLKISFERIAFIFFIFFFIAITFSAKTIYLIFKKNFNFIKIDLSRQKF